MADKTSWTPPPKGVGLGYELKLTNLTPSPPHLKLDPREGGMDLEVDFSSFSANVSLENECKVLFIDLCPDVSGTMMIDGVEIEADLWASATNGELDVSLTGADVDVGWINVSIDGLSTVMNLLGLGTWTFIVDLVIDVIINLFSGTVEGAIAGGLGPALETAFTSLITNMQIHDNYATGSLLTGLPTATFAFDTVIDNMKFTPDGGRVEFATRILSSKKIYQSSPGSISRGTCLKGLMAGTTLPGDYEFESSYKDDVANAILTAAWRNGALNGNITMSAFPYALLSGGFEVDDQPVMGMELEMMYTLPPILNSCDPSGVTFIQVGDLYLQGEVTSAAFASGEGEFGVYVSFELLSATEVAEGFWGDTVGLGLGALYAIHYHWEMLPPEFEADPEPLEAFIEELFWKGINNQLTSPLGNFEIHGLGFADSVPGVEIAPTIQVLSRDGGAVVFQGELP
jgi:hypothetical protein